MEMNEKNLNSSNIQGEESLKGVSETRQSRSTKQQRKLVACSCFYATLLRDRRDTIATPLYFYLKQVQPTSLLQVLL